ncbi:MAG TPA: M28 family peptidase [Mucilaginibacter sp.]
MTVASTTNTIVKVKFIALFLFVSNIVAAQDLVFARKMLDTLTSSRFWGRGYTNHGMQKAALFLTKQLKSYGVSPMDDNTFAQNFGYPVNTFPGKMEVMLNGMELVPGKDFLVSPDSRGIKAKGKLVQVDSTHFVDKEDHILVVLKDKLTWSVKPAAADYTIIQLNKKQLKALPTSIKVNIRNKEIGNFKTANICGIIKGTVKPDSVIVFTAHYDHLGGMGDKTFFPGANDNASGVTQVLTMAKYYAGHPQPYSIAFILFAGEEAGLLGSKYFTENPLIPLKSIKFLVNLDLEGTGIDGITVVNAAIYPNEFNLLKQVNDKGKFMVKVNSRGKAANSDHYLFTEKGVPSFFVYTTGGIAAYHDIYDISATLPLNEYENLFNLLTKFNDRLMNKKLAE